MSEENKKIRIGEFARVNGVTKHTLIHYDDIGLLTPAITEETATGITSTSSIRTFPISPSSKSSAFP